MKSEMRKRGVCLLCILVVSVLLLLPAITIASGPLAWETKSPLPTAMSRMDATILNGQIYVVGEFDVMQYEPASDQWSFTTPPSEQVFYPSVLTSADTIYMIGGGTFGSDISDTHGIRTYDPVIGSTRVASTLEPRFFADAVALNGKIYIAGGGSEAFSSTDTLSLAIEEFDPNTGVSQVVAQLPAGRFHPAVETDGEWIYILGGQDDTGNPTATCWAFNPVTGEFKANASMINPVWNRGAFSAMGKIYMVGGITQPDNPTGPPSEWTTDIQEYDPMTDSWLVVGQIPTSRYTHAAVVAGEILYVMGGDLGDNDQGNSVETDIVESASLSTTIGSLTWETKSPMPYATSRMDTAVINGQIHAIGEFDTFQYDPNIDLWSYTAPLGEQVFLPAVVNIDDSIYLVGGETTSSGMPDTHVIWTYDPAQGATRIGTTVEPRFFADSVALNGKIYTVGGSPGDPLALSLAIEEFDPASGISEVVGMLPAGRLLPAVETDGNWLYILGGMDETGIPTATCWAFNPATGEFRTNTPMLTPVWTRSAIVYMGKIYLVGGVSGSGGPMFSGPPTEFTSDIQEYDPMSDSWQVVGQVPTLRYTPGVAMANDTLYVMGGDLGDNGPDPSFDTDIVEAASFGMQSFLDNDGDGYVEGIDCNDADPLINPGASEILYNDIDENCNGMLDDLGALAESRAALIDLYNATGGDSWNDNTGWKTLPLYGDGFAMPGTECDWRGVTCDTNGSITSLIIVSNNLVGSIPPSLGNLTSLTSLNLRANQLSGPIPDELINLTGLTSLNLESNQFSGSIPAELSNLTNLTWLSLAGNQLSGPIPSQLGNLTSLTALHLFANQLSGSIPSELGNLTGLTSLFLLNNQLSGPIPVELGNLSSLKFLFLQSNQLSGPIPAELGNLTSLDSLWLQSNQLSGPIPVDLINLGQIVLDISYNALYSTDASLTAFLDSYSAGWSLTQTVAPVISAAIATTDSITVEWTPISFTGEAGYYEVWYSQTSSGPYNLYGATADKSVSSMNVTGLANETTYYFVVRTISETHANNQNVLISSFSAENAATTLSHQRAVLIDLYNSTDADDSWQNSTSWKTPPLHVDGFSMPGTECSWFGVGCDLDGNITSINFSYSRLAGTIPASLGSLSTLRSLNLGFSEFTGPIPPELGNLTELLTLRLNHNRLSGPIPPELANLTKLTQLEFYANQLSGSIPVELSNMTNLISLSLGSNQLSGPIPPELGNMASLGYLGLSINQLSGTIPAELGNLTGLTGLSLEYNQLSDSIPVELGNLTSLKTLNLSNNQLSSIPTELGNLTNLTSLSLSSNLFSRPFPVELGNLIKLTSLDLNNNQFNGPIPVELGNLTNLTSLNLQFNRLQGAIPVELGNLTRLTYLRLGDNALYSNDAALTAFLDSKSAGWSLTQTVAPVISAGFATNGLRTINWTPIVYSQGYGGYEVLYSQTSGGPYTLYDTTVDKTVSSMEITGLDTDTTYYFVVRTKTDWSVIPNQTTPILSEFSNEISEFDYDRDLDDYPMSMDCDDANPSIFPGADEVLSDGIDQDCNGYDLTISITKAEYLEKNKKISVYATSALESTASLELEGYGLMDWIPNKNRWELDVKKIEPTDVPVNVTVFGVEGGVSLPVSWK